MIVPEKALGRSARLPTTLPLQPVRDLVIFPWSVLPLEVSRPKSIRALDEAMASHGMVFISTQKDENTKDPQGDDIYAVGTICHVLEKMPNAPLKILVEGRARARVKAFRFLNDQGYNEVDVELIDETSERSAEVTALMRQTTQLFDQFVKLTRRVSVEVSGSLINIEEPGRLSDTIASYLPKISDRQLLLEMPDPKERLAKLAELLTLEIEIATLEKRLDMRVRSQVEKTQREYYLNERMKAIQKELKQKDDGSKEMDELREKVKAAQMSTEATEAADKELSRLEKMMPFSPEATVIRSYVEWLISLPWIRRSQDQFDIPLAQKQLDSDHYGLEKPKERMVEYLAVLKLVKKIRGPILCFVGPPGVGKTSLARSIATALGREFVKMSLGGVRDESEIRGHRRTYIGSMPGRLIQSLRKGKTKNPVFLLDEIDKMGTDWRGDPAAALLEVLDPEQNSHFVDHFLDVEFDLSEVLFICTSNTLASIPPSLYDRLEVIRFSGYTEQEKFQIAKKYLLPKQLKDHGLDPALVTLSDPALLRVVREYTREAGVRNLERQIARLCRKAAKRLVSHPELTTTAIGEKEIPVLLGVPEFLREHAAENAIGVATGMAWTENGGELLAIEVAQMPGKGKLTLTGKLGDVMQESAQAALSFIRMHAKKLKIKDVTFKTHDYHIHVPEGATPKDGPSAGTAIAAALVSAMTRRPVKKKIAMTGEVTLHGRVLPIGGLKEKTLAAYREGIETVLFPEGNRKDLHEIPDDVKSQLKMIPVSHMEQVLSAVFPLRSSK